jgi:hypothetical protein
MKLHIYNFLLSQFFVKIFNSYITVSNQIDSFFFFFLEKNETSKIS